MTNKSFNTSRFESHISIACADKTALDHLAEDTSLSKQKLKHAMSNGCAWLESANGIHRIRRAKKLLNKGDKLHFYYDEGIQNIEPAAAELIADEGEYSIWNKPYGMYSQGTKWGDHCSVYRWAELHLKPQRPAFLIHRLDRATTGLIIVAHSKKTAAAFARLFQNRNIQKQYKATVEGELHIESLPFIINDEIDNKAAISKIIKLEAHGKNKTIVTIEIETGRKHQIRKHLSQSGFPIVGDRLYGSNQSQEEFPMINLQLQSTYLKFSCPLTNAIREYSLE